jgi:membrane fusion protein, copper/silver efflux system
VRRGQPLAELYSPEVLAAEEELLVARRLGATLGASDVPGVPAPAADLLAAARRRLLLLGVGEDEVERVLRDGRARRTVTLRAPASGVVLEKRVTEGQAVAAGEPLYTVADLGSVWVEAELRGGDAAGVAEGAAADVELAASPGRALKGRVAYVQPTLDAATRTVRARVVVANSDGRLRPGTYATVRFSAPARRALTVPASAVVRTGDRSLVFVDMGGGRLMPQDVETGRAAGELVEVLAGLEPGQRVVTSAQYLLESESNLADVMRAMMGQMGAQEMKGMPGMESMPGMPR